MLLAKLLKTYDYCLPEKLIAQKPASPRDSARLLVYDKKNKIINFDIFKNIGKYLPKNTVLVFNQTKVIPARIKIMKPTGGKAELLYLEHDKKFIKALCNKKLPLNSYLSFFDGRLKRKDMTVIKKGKQYYF